MISESHLRKAIKIAQKSNHQAFSHSALLIRGGNIVASASNWSWSHAEKRILAKTWDSVQKGSVLLSIRITATKKLACGKPCPACEKLIRESGIKRVFYSTSERTIEEMRF